MIAIVDYGVGNLFSLKSSFAAVGADTAVTAEPEEIRAADKILLPGVGAFGDARRKLAAPGLDRLLTEEVAAGKPLLGVCLGMQLLFERSFEYGEHEGLGLIPGEVVPFSGRIDGKLRIPAIGWNALHFKKAESPLLKYIEDGAFVYFVHSYFADCPEEYRAADAEYGLSLPAVVENGRVYGCQFHPEKSGAVGLNILRAFAEL